MPEMTSRPGDGGYRSPWLHAWFDKLANIKTGPTGVCMVDLEGRGEHSLLIADHDARLRCYAGTRQRSEHTLADAPSSARGPRRNDGVPSSAPRRRRGPFGAAATPSAPPRSLRRRRAATTRPPSFRRSRRPENASQVCGFYADERSPAIPSVAVAAGPHVFVYRNLRPFVRWTAPVVSLGDCPGGEAFSF